MVLDRDTALRSLLGQRADLLGYIRAIVGDPHLAEDVFQEVALAVVRKHAEVADEAHLAGWVRKAARFQALSALRQRRKDQPFDETLLDLIDESWESAASEQPTGAALRALRGCCELLPPSSQRLVALRYHENRSGEEMAQLLGRPINTVYVTLSRIHKLLTQCVRQRLAQGKPDAC